MSFKRLGIKRSDFNGSKKYCWHKFKSLLSKVSKSLSVTFACNSKAFPSVIIEILFESKNYLSIKKKCLYLTYVYFPFNIMGVIRNAFLNSVIYHILDAIKPKPKRSKNTRFHNSCFF